LLCATLLPAAPWLISPPPRSLSPPIDPNI
jgi:hypothetical protein